MVFLEGIIINLVIVIMIMYIDKYVLEDLCRGYDYIDCTFRVWLTVIFLSVFWVLANILIDEILTHYLLHTPKLI